MNKLSLLTILIAAFYASMGYAQVQERGDEDTLRNQMRIIVSYKPTVADAKKIAESPSTVDTALAKPGVRYLYENTRYETSYNPEPIKSAKMKNEPLNPLYRAHAKLGAGNGINYLADVHVNTLRSRNGALGLKLNGFGTQGNIQETTQPAPFNRWNGEAYGKKFFKKHALSGQLGYDRERVQYYGYDDTNPFYFDASNNAFKQVYNDWYLDGRLTSFYSDSSKVNHDIRAHYNYFSDLYAANAEHNARVKANLNTFFGKHKFDLDVLADFNSAQYKESFTFQPYDTIGQTINNFIVNIHPKFVSESDNFKLVVGMQLQGEITGEGSSPFVYPDVSAKYNLVKDLLIPYASVRGFFGRGVTRTNLNSLTEENPFVWTSLTPLQNEKEMYQVSLGLRGAVSHRFTYNLYGEIRRLENLPLFVNYNASQFNLGANRFGENFFLVNYDTVQIQEIGGELTYRIDEKLQLLASGKFRTFETTQEFEAWQLPNFEGHLSGFYQLRNKIILKGELHAFGPRLARSLTSAGSQDDFVGFDDRFNANIYKESLPLIVDLSLGVEYRYTERLAAFIDVRNLVAQRYQYWNQYPVQRFNVMFGVNCSFWKD